MAAWNTAAQLTVVNLILPIFCTPIQAGGRNWLLRLTEGKALPRILLATEAALALLLAGTNAATWADFWRLFHQSRLIHLATLDFVALTVLSGLIAAYDASRRGIPRNVLVPVAAGCMIPLVGPTVYLLLRPSAYVAPGAPVRVRARRAGAAVRGAAKKSTGWLERVLPAGVHDALAGAWEAVPGRRWFEARLTAVKHRLRRVGSTVFQVGLRRVGAPLACQSCLHCRSCQFHGGMLNQ